MRLALGLWLALSAPLWSQPKRILYVTHSAGFRHASIEVSRQVLSGLAPGELDITPTEDLSRITAAGLQSFDAVFFFTSGELALSAQQKSDLLNFVRAGGGFGGAHSATDTLYTWPEYGELIGGVFDGHPWVQEASIDIEDPQHPITQGLAPSWRITEEFYQFRNFSRDRVRVLMTLDTRSVDLNAPGVNRTDRDFALAWVRTYGAGRVFYTALGHFDETWQDPRFQQSLRAGLRWITHLVEGDASIPPRVPAMAATPQNLAPGAAVELYGAGLTTGATMTANALNWKYRLAGTRILINSEEVPLLYASPTQVNLQIPTGLDPESTADIAITVGDTTTPLARAPVHPAVPVIRAVVTRAAALEIYATGLGETEVPIPTGDPAPLDRLIRTRLLPHVRLAGSDVPVTFSGLAPGWIALYQVNVLIPDGLSGDTQLELEAGGRHATIPLRIP